MHGGRGICNGPNNYLANAYFSVPVSITVEGANILTRSMIIFGQGAIRCHPHALDELQAVASLSCSSRVSTPLASRSLSTRAIVNLRASTPCDEPAMPSRPETSQSWDRNNFV